MNIREKMKNLCELDQADLISILNVGATTVEEAIAAIEAIVEIVENKPCVAIPYFSVAEPVVTSSSGVPALIDTAIHSCGTCKHFSKRHNGPGYCKLLADDVWSTEHCCNFSDDVD